ncbi:MAG: UvrD-helicase domain-containing protein, partial [Elusimicrobia bacterium]|nr:UvrD-helicase domain-containing protein [Elusimicrobiota bacterium]
VGLGDLGLLARSLAKFPPYETDTEPLLIRLVDLRSALEQLPEGKPKPARGDMLKSLSTIAERLAAVERVLRQPACPVGEPTDWKESCKKWPTEWKDFSGESVYKEAWDLAKRISPEGEAILFRARRLLRPFTEPCRQRYRAQGWLGFDDLLRGARDLLARHPTVRRELKERYGAVLVDEFQDTDPLQGEMLLFLAEGPDSAADRWNDVRLEPGKLFIVGDPKQSIYRFRGADIRAYEAFVFLVISQGGVKCDLQTSFRTHERIVDPVNRLFSGLMREEKGLQPAYLPLLPRPNGNEESSEAGRSASPSTVGGEVDLIVVDGGPAAEARWIARWIVDHCGPDGSGRPWRLGDVALLFRSTSPLAVYMAALKDAKIPYRVESDRAFYGTPEVTDFLNLLRVLDDPDDRVSWVGLLRSPWMMVEDRHVMALAESGCWEGGPSVPPEVNSRITGVVEILKELRHAARTESLGALAARVLEETPFVAACAAAYHGEQTVANLHKMARLAAEAGETRGETVGGFIRRVAGDVGRGVEEGENPLGEERTEAVRLLTVHKAKGLEYKVVILPNLSATVRGSSHRPVAFRLDWAEGRAGHRLVKRKWADLAMAFMDIDERRREKEEAIRLFYVASTRAREQVILVGGEKSSAGSFMDMLLGQSQLALAPRQIVPDNGPTPLWSEGKRSSPPLFTRDLERVWAKRRADGDLAQGRPLFGRPSQGGHLRESAVWAEDSSPAAGARSAWVGQLCHGVLELWEWGKSDISSLLDRALRRLGPEIQSAPEVLQDARDILSAYFSSPLGRSFERAEIVAREAPFLYPDGDVIVRGVIDMLYRRDGGLWVADYKTDHVEASTIEESARRYEAQGTAYCKAVGSALGEKCGFEVIFLRLHQRVILRP